jgi:hypothetical protein
MDPVFASGLRDALNAQVHGATRRRRRWRWSLGLGVVIGSSVVAGGAALAAVLLSQPGARVDTPLANPVIVTRTGTATVDLGPPPRGATNISLTLTCHSAGTFYFPDGSSAICSATEGRQGSSQVSEVVPLATGQRTATIKASPGASWTLQAVYVNQVTTSWGTNARGETYGVFNQSGTPDLVAVAIDGGTVDGYVSASDLSCASGGDVRSPAQALAWDRASHDTNVVISVYKSDGVTVIGAFDVGDTGPDVRTVPLSSISKEFCQPGPKSPSTANPGTTVQSPPTTVTRTP